MGDIGICLLSSLLHLCQAYRNWETDYISLFHSRFARLVSWEMGETLDVAFTGSRKRPPLIPLVYLYLYTYTYTYNPNDPCFDSKRPCFEGLPFKKRGQ